MSMNPEDFAGYANMFSNSNAGGKMPKKKSAAAVQRAKAKGLKGAAAIALGQPAGKKGKDSKNKGSSNKGSGSKGSGSSSSSSKSKPVTNTGSPYATAAVSKAKSIADAKAASMNSAAFIALGSRSKRQPSVKDYQYAYNQAAGMALGNPMKAQPKTAPKTAPKKK